MKLRQTALAWFMGGGCMLPLAILLAVLTIMAPHPVTVGFMLLALGVLFIPALSGARVADGEISFGPHWKRRAVQIAAVERVVIGPIIGFGVYGATVNGLVIVDSDGTTQLVGESRYCNQDRLRSWASEIQSRNPAINVHVIDEPMPAPSR